MTRRRLITFHCIAAILLAFAVTGRSAILLDPPEAFFTNVAQRILHTMSGDFAPVTNVNAIMIWPTNYYGNGLHRIMQQAANIYEATRSNDFPTVFRPQFGNLGTTNLYIVGWINDNNPATLDSWLADNQFGIPLVIAAKKGLPNFNEFNLRTYVLVTRKLQLRRPDTSSVPTQTNQMYIVGISNRFAVEAWNSYYAKFPLASTIEVSNTITLTITNFVGILSAQTFYLSSITNIPANAWTGWPGFFSGPSQAASFKLPLTTNVTLLSNAVYVAQNNRFEQVGTNVYEAWLLDSFYLPNWKLVLSNHLVYIHRAGTNIIDFVNLRDVAMIDLSSILATKALSPPTATDYMWNTNRYFGSFGPTEGIRNQIAFSQVQGNNADWNAFSTFYGSFQGINNDRDLAARKFRDFMGSNSNAITSAETPFNPVARFIYNKSWQANDPLVHYHVDDLTVFSPSITLDPVKWRELNLDKFGASSITNVNRGYAPWGNWNDPNSFDYRLRDPRVDSSESWNFPSAKNLSIDWLGRVHRGTPWQTVYLKAARDFGGYNTGFPLTSDEWFFYANSTQNHPTNDWRLATLLAPLFNTNDSLNLHSVNPATNIAWGTTFTGLTVMTNILDDNEVVDPINVSLRFSSYSIHADAPQLPLLIDAIDRARASQPLGFFTDVSALLAIPELSNESPWLNRSDIQRAAGISDEAYEILPAQLLSRLRVDPVLTLSRTSDGIMIELTGCEGCAYELQASPDLETWTDVSGPHVTTNGVHQLPLSSTESVRFLRVQELR